MREDAMADSIAASCENDNANVDSYATLDEGREQRCGFGEVIYAAGKEPSQVLGIMHRMLQTSRVALATRATHECASLVLEGIPDAIWAPRAKILFVDRRDAPMRVCLAGCEGEAREPAKTSAERTITDILPLLKGGVGGVTVCCAGTSDLPVAEEAALTCRIMGSATTLMTDIGIAGVHRALSREQDLRKARAIVVVAGMEGALPSLIAGLVDVPVFAVPTSVGYGASFGGLAALLGMLCSCAGGVSVVNIDNGFGAGQCADRVNRTPERFCAEGGHA